MCYLRGTFDWVVEGQAGTIFQVGCSNLAPQAGYSNLVPTWHPQPGIFSPAWFLPGRQVARLGQSPGWAASTGNYVDFCSVVVCTRCSERSNTALLTMID